MSSISPLKYTPEEITSFALKGKYLQQDKHFSQVCVIKEIGGIERAFRTLFSWTTLVDSVAYACAKRSLDLTVESLNRYPNIKLPSCPFIQRMKNLKEERKIDDISAIAKLPKLERIFFEKVLNKLPSDSFGWSKEKEEEKLPPLPNIDKILDERGIPLSTDAAIPVPVEKEQYAEIAEKLLNPIRKEKQSSVESLNWMINTRKECLAAAAIKHNCQKEVQEELNKRNISFSLDEVKVLSDEEAKNLPADSKMPFITNKDIDGAGAIDDTDYDFLKNKIREKREREMRIEKEIDHFIKEVLFNKVFNLQHLTFEMLQSSLELCTKELETQLDQMGSPDYALGMAEGKSNEWTSQLAMRSLSPSHLPSSSFLYSTNLAVGIQAPMNKETPKNLREKTIVLFDDNSCSGNQIVNVLYAMDRTFQSGKKTVFVVIPFMTEHAHNLLSNSEFNHLNVRLITSPTRIQSAKEVLDPSDTIGSLDDKVWAVADWRKFDDTSTPKFARDIIPEIQRPYALKRK